MGNFLKSGLKKDGTVFRLLWKGCRKIPSSSVKSTVSVLKTIRHVLRPRHNHLSISYPMARSRPIDTFGYYIPLVRTGQIMKLFEPQPPQAQKAPQTPHLSDVPFPHNSNALVLYNPRVLETFSMRFPQVFFYKNRMEPSPIAWVIFQNTRPPLAICAPPSTSRNIKKISQIGRSANGWGGGY